MEEYLNELAEKYKGRAKIEMLFGLNLLSIILLAVWVYSVDAEQNRRTDAVEKVRSEMIN